MKRTAVYALATCVALLILHLNSQARAGQAAKTDVSGVWIFTLESAAGTSNPTVTFKQEGDKLTGQYSSPLSAGEFGDGTFTAKRK